MPFSSSSPARVILAVDAPGWAFHHIASQIQHHMGLYKEPMEIGIGMSSEMRNVECDLCVVFPWKDTLRVSGENRCHRIVTCIYDDVTWTATDPMQRAMGMAIEESSAIGVANEQIGDMLRHRRLIKRPVFLIEDGVDRGMFKPSPAPPPVPFTVGWVGNSGAGHSTIKGLDIVREACRIAGVELKVADLASGNPIPHGSMPSWYQGISVLVCASTSEGTPNPPLEAMACARPVITTRVGLMGRIVSDGVNGVFVQRDPQDIARAILAIMRSGNYMAMGAAARDAVEAHGWEVKSIAWRSMLRAVLKVGLL